MNNPDPPVKHHMDVYRETTDDTMNNPDPPQTPEEEITLTRVSPPGPEYIRIPTDVGDAMIPIGLEDDDLKRLLAAIELYRAKILTPIALPATSLPPDPTPATKAKKKRVQAKRAGAAKGLVTAPTAPATPTASTEGREIEEGYLMDRSSG